jgi:hypothetical protein
VPCLENFGFIRESVQLSACPVVISTYADKLQIVLAVEPKYGVLYPGVRGNFFLFCVQKITRSTSHPTERETDCNVPGVKRS